MREELENILKDVWIKTNEENVDVNISDYPRELIDELVSHGYLLKKDGRIFLTAKGEEKARKIIRLHRLAERLLSDVLSIADVEESACRFEHILSEEVEEAICTLLGHPSVCPHGRPIPKGKCCLKGENRVQRLIFRLSELNPGDEGEVKYILADDAVSKKIIAVGLLPGRRFKVIRVFPTYVIQMDNTHFALDKQIAETIYCLKL
jgi:DtxR family Mn-dependent transcriptional regulator